MALGSGGDMCQLYSNKQNQNGNREKQQQNKTKPSPPQKKTQQQHRGDIPWSTNIQSIPLVEHQDSKRSYICMFICKLEWKHIWPLFNNMWTHVGTLNWSLRQPWAMFRWGSSLMRGCPWCVHSSIGSGYIETYHSLLLHRSYRVRLYCQPH